MEVTLHRSRSRNYSVSIVMKTLFLGIAAIAIGFGTVSLAEHALTIPKRQMLLANLDTVPLIHAQQKAVTVKAQKSDATDAARHVDKSGGIDNSRSCDLEAGISEACIFN